MLRRVAAERRAPSRPRWQILGSARNARAGLCGARLLKSFLYGVSASDPITFTFIAFTLLTIAFLACWIPPGAPAASTL